MLNSDGRGVYVNFRTTRTTARHIQLLSLWNITADRRFWNTGQFDLTEKYAYKCIQQQCVPESTCHFLLFPRMFNDRRQDRNRQEKLFPFFMASHRILHASCGVRLLKSTTSRAQNEFAFWKRLQVVVHRVWLNLYTLTISTKCPQLPAWPLSIKLT